MSMDHKKDKLDVIIENQAKELNKGFDKADAEKKKPKAEIEILGKVFMVPSNMPGWVPFFIGRYGIGKDKDVPPEKYLQFLVKICGEEIVDHIIDNAPNDMDSADIEKEVVDKIKACWDAEAKKKMKPGST
jgi:hypothetical protein